MHIPTAEGVWEGVICGACYFLNRASVGVSFLLQAAREYNKNWMLKNRPENSEIILSVDT